MCSRKSFMKQAVILVYQEASLTRCLALLFFMASLATSVLSHDVSMEKDIFYSSNDRNGPTGGTSPVKTNVVTCGADANAIMPNWQDPNCRTYFQCADLVPYMYSCPVGQAYNARLNDCIDYHKINCKSQNKAVRLAMEASALMKRASDPSFTLLRGEDGGGPKPMIDTRKLAQLQGAGRRNKTRGIKNRLLRRMGHSEQESVDKDNTIPVMLPEQLCAHDLSTFDIVLAQAMVNAVLLSETGCIGRRRDCGMPFLSLRCEESSTSQDYEDNELNSESSGEGHGENDEYGSGANHRDWRRRGTHENHNNGDGRPPFDEKSWSYRTSHEQASWQRNGEPAHKYSHVHHHHIHHHHGFHGGHFGYEDGFHVNMEWVEKEAEARAEAGVRGSLNDSKVNNHRVVDKSNTTEGDSKTIDGNETMTKNAESDAVPNGNVDKDDSTRTMRDFTEDSRKTRSVASGEINEEDDSEPMLSIDVDALPRVDGELKRRDSLTVITKTASDETEVPDKPLDASDEKNGAGAGSLDYDLNDSDQVGYRVDGVDFKDGTTDERAGVVMNAGDLVEKMIRDAAAKTSG